MKAWLKLSPIFKEKIWGSTGLASYFGYDLSSPQVGECWMASGLEGDSTAVAEGAYKGVELNLLWQQAPELFGYYPEDAFPILIKTIDAADDLSIQVHPNTDQAKVMGNGYRAKTECWLVLDCPENAEIVFGHTAKSREELERKIKEGQWQHLLAKQKVKVGDFIYVPGGTVHALTKGIMVMEIQQSSDTTFRVYDYGRLEKGKPRQLHIEESLRVIEVPHVQKRTEVVTVQYPRYSAAELIRSVDFTVYRYQIKGPVLLEQPFPFMVMTAVEGSGEVDGRAVKAGDTWILTSDYGNVFINGHLTVVAATKEYPLEYTLQKRVGA